MVISLPMVRSTEDTGSPVQTIRVTARWKSLLGFGKIRWATSVAANRTGLDWTS